jgi:hypothetical protein
MSLLEHPDAQALLADAVVTPEQVRGCRDRLTDFLRRYFYSRRNSLSSPQGRIS